jgi:hypothetical protein
MNIPLGELQFGIFIKKIIGIFIKKIICIFLLCNRSHAIFTIKIEMCEVGSTTVKVNTFFISTHESIG